MFLWDMALVWKIIMIIAVLLSGLLAFGIFVWLIKEAIIDCRKDYKQLKEKGYTTIGPAITPFDWWH